MSADIVLGYELNDTGYRLTVGGSKVVLDSIFDSKKRPMKFNGKQTFTKLDETDEQVVWGFNAKAVGRMKPKYRGIAISSANLVLGELVVGPSYRVGRADNLVRLTQYQADPNNGFSLGAEIVLPRQQTSNLSAFVTARMIEMATDLRYVDKVEKLHDDLRYLSPTFHMGPSGLQFNLDKTSANMHVPGEDWGLDLARVRLVGRDILDGEQALIYLAGAVALGNADMLAQG